MKKITLVLSCFIVAFTSCKNTWDSETKEMFHQSCMEEATWAESEEQKKTYCDCVLEKTMTKYPKMDDALEHIDSVITDPDIKACRLQGQ